MVNIAGLEMKNPVMVASGTFSKDCADYLNLDKLGAIVTKTITLNEKPGNPPPRICETPSGMLNSIGLQNPGIKAFIEKDLPFYAKYKTPLIASIAGTTIEEYAQCAKILSAERSVKALELNVSCPNVKQGGMAFGTDPKIISALIKAVKKNTPLPIIVKLTPNVTDIVEIALAAEKAGADAITAINTVLAMAFDIKTGQPKLANGMGGLSGPAIKPIAIRCVYQICQKVKIPAIGCGGIMSKEDMQEFFLAGAKAVQVGCGNFIDPELPLNLIR